MEKALALILLAVLIAGCTQSQTQPPPEAAQTNTVLIKNFAFNPASLSVEVGTTVTWVNEDSAPHTISSEKFSSSTLNKGDSFQFTFNEKGIYSYSCGIHPSMSGKIVVE